MATVDPHDESRPPAGEGADEAASESEPDAPPEPGEKPSTELESLRELLIAPERTSLNDLRRRLDTPEVRTREMARYLSDAIHLASRDDERMGQVLQPSIEQALKQSVRRNPRQIVDAIFPVMGPAIRRAIVSTLMGMLQSLNKVIDHTFTLKGIKWRLEALTSGRTFAEVVLLHTLIYQIEQVYLIHRSTGLVLTHVVPPDAISQDPDLISSMLTAIQDFVRDSFSDAYASPGEDSLNTLRMGADRSIWIEQSPQVSIAAVIRGTPPEELRTQLREILERVQITHAAKIDTFDGDPQGFADLRSQLDACLQARFKVEEKRLAPLTQVLLFLLTGALVGGGVWLLYREHRWQAFIETLRQQDGIVVTQVEKTDGRRHFFGLRDPYAVSPQTLLDSAGLPADKVVWHWRGYYDMAPELVLKRIQERLKPPQSVSLDFANGRLKIKGFARHRWIEAASQMVAGMAAVAAVDRAELRDLDLIQARSDADRLAAKMVYFAPGAFEIDADNAAILSDVVTTVSRLVTLSDASGIGVQLVIIGHTDESGSREKNITLARRRAEGVREHLIRQGIPAHRLSAIGISSRAADPAVPRQEQLNRSVTFQVVING
jgi:outer membrane protein OmpA-like peptidoglycan-associated protein